MSKSIKQESLSRSYTMEGGDGPSSYAKNSTFQGKVIELTKELIHQAIADTLDLKSMCLASSSCTNKFVIADFGCSTGPNTFVSVQNIIEAIELGNPSVHQDLIFQVFFNDHVSNDFNTLFKTIPASSRYYAAGVPGSFHGRLFPESSLHIAHTSYSLHWMSKAPEGIRNKGKIFWNDAEKGVAEAYLAQYTNDMDSFLSARATEIVVGGLLIMCITVRPNGVILNRSGFTFILIGSCLVDMAKEGIILTEDVDSFNVPIYLPTFDELQEIIHKNGSFSIERMEAIKNKELKSVNSKMMAALYKSVFGTLLRDHFHCDIMDELLVRFQEKYDKNVQYVRTLDYTDMFLVLKCKTQRKE